MHKCILWTLTGLLAILTRVQSETEYSEAICQRKWTERMRWEKSAARNPPPDDLRTHILLGKPTKVILTKGTYQESFVLDNINMNGQVICGETIERMSYPIGPNAEYEPIIVCTDGYVSYLNASASSWDSNVKSHVWDIEVIRFMTRDYSPGHQPVTSRYVDGSSSTEYEENFITMATKSEIMGVMRDRGYVFTMENTHIDPSGNSMSGQSLSHISQSYTSAGGITFRDQPYHWLSSWDTSGLRDSARWRMGDMAGLKHTNDHVSLHWFADACWTIAYVHDDKGTRLAGSLDMFKMYVKMGHRVRVHFNGYTLEASSVFISPDDAIVAQTSAEMARRGGSGNDKTFFNTKTRQVYRLVHTSGLVRTLMYFVEKGQLSAKRNENFKVTWSVDTRPWNPVVSMNSSNAITVGSASDLLQAMDSSSIRVKVELKEKDTRFTGKTSELYMEINNVRVSDNAAAEPEVVGQSLRTVPFYQRSDDKNFMMYLYNPSRQYIQVSSKMGVTAARFHMSSRDYQAVTDWQIEGITWYKDHRIEPL